MLYSGHNPPAQTEAGWKGGGDSLARRISLLESWSRLFQWSQTELTLHLSARSVVCACVNHLGLSKADFDFYVFQIRIRSPAFPPPRTVTHTVSHLCAIILSGAVRTLGHQQVAPPWHRAPSQNSIITRNRASREHGSPEDKSAAYMLSRIPRLLSISECRGVGSSASGSPWSRHQP